MDSEETRVSNNVYKDTIRLIIESCDEETAVKLRKQLQYQREQYSLGYSAPELLDARCWQAAFNALEIAIPNPSPELSKLWQDGLEKMRKKLDYGSALKSAQ